MVVVSVGILVDLHCTYLLLACTCTCISYSHMEDERIVVALAVLLGVNVPEGGTLYMYMHNACMCVYFY